MSDLKPNATLAYAALDQIDLHPETWLQSEWQCGTAACFAGWVVRLSGGTMLGEGSVDVVVGGGLPELRGELIDRAAETLLGLPVGEYAASWDDHLFDPDNTREDLGRIVEKRFGPRPDSYGAGCRCDYLGEGTPEHDPSPLCRSLRPDAERQSTPGGDL